LTEAKLISALNKENLSHISKTYVPSRLLLGPGPSNAHPEVLNALSLNPIGHLDEAYISLMLFPPPQVIFGLLLLSIAVVLIWDIRYNPFGEDEDGI